MRARRLAKVFYDISVNITSGWLGILFVSPGFFGATSFDEYWGLLRANLPFVIIGIGICYWLSKRSDS